MSETPRSPPPRNAVDRFIRRFNVLSHVAATLTLYGLGVVALALALAPALWVGQSLREVAAPLPGWQKWPLLGFARGLGFFLFGFVLMIVVAIFNFGTPSGHDPGARVRALPLPRRQVVVNRPRRLADGPMARMTVAATRRPLSKQPVSGHIWNGRGPRSVATTP